VPNPEDNVAVIRALFAANARRDEDALRRLLDPDVVYHVPGTNRASGHHRGHDGLLAFFAMTREAEGANEHFVAELHDITASADHVVVLARGLETRADRRLAWRMAIVFHLSGGRVTEGWAHVVEGYDDWDMFWS
jgi:ketosteroid isomerase-like protein